MHGVQLSVSGRAGVGDARGRLRALGSGVARGDGQRARAGPAGREPAARRVEPRSGIGRPITAMERKCTRDGEQIRAAPRSCRPRCSRRSGRTTAPTRTASRGPVPQLREGDRPPVGLEYRAGTLRSPGSAARPPPGRPGRARRCRSGRRRGSPPGRRSPSRSPRGPARATALRRAVRLDRPLHQEPGPDVERIVGSSPPCRRTWRKTPGSRRRPAGRRRPPGVLVADPARPPRRTRPAAWRGGGSGSPRGSDRGRPRGTTRSGPSGGPAPRQHGQLFLPGLHSLVIHRWAPFLERRAVGTSVAMAVAKRLYLTFSCSRM